MLSQTCSAVLYTSHYPTPHKSHTTQKISTSMPLISLGSGISSKSLTTLPLSKTSLNLSRPMANGQAKVYECLKQCNFVRYREELEGMRGSKGLLMVRCQFLEIADHHHSVNSSYSISTFSSLKQYR